MKRICFFMLLFISVQLHAQYQIDLRKVKEPSIKYLELGNPGPAGKEIRVNNLYMTEGGKPVTPVMGEFHYSRYDHRFWKDELLKMKASGIDIVSTYVIWILHEEIEGSQEWTGNKNLRRFIELCKEVGLKVHLRAGPYCNAEIRNGGFPDWLVTNKNIKRRSNDPLYLAYCEKWYQSVYKQVEGFLYKDGGPVMALQLENEYVTPGMVVPHLMTLKKMAVETGFDVPIYSMTHWMASDYPKGEVIPYAGYYIEAPWTYDGRRERPVSNFEFFNYNRIADNIGTDIIKQEYKIESLTGAQNDSPYFTCEVGLGSPAFYNSRAIVPEEMAGENVNLRLGCGVNLMGYYMYVGGSNPVGLKTTLQSSGPRVNYDYQAPIKEFGTLGIVTKEAKKFNYFMNDFGESLAPAVAYLPTSNQDTTNLQWAVRSDGESGYLFCSNYLYKHSRKDYRQVQFQVDLKNEKLRFPRNPITVKNESYFFWPFNLKMEGVTLSYSTTQPICTLTDGNIQSYFFFAEDNIPGEYLIKDRNIKEINVSKGSCKKEKSAWFIDGLTPGKDCWIEITKNDGKRIRLITLTKDDSKYIWKGHSKGKDFVAITNSSLIYDDKGITLIDENEKQEVWMYEGYPTDKPVADKKGLFGKYMFSTEPSRLSTSFVRIPSFNGAGRITPASGKNVSRVFDGESLSSVENAYLRFQSDGYVKCFINDSLVTATATKEYRLANLKSMIVNGKNNITFELEDNGQSIIAEIEVLLRNGTRWVWNTDGTWINSDNKPVKCVDNKRRPVAYAPEEHIALYEVKTPYLTDPTEEVRLYISFTGDYADAYINNRLINDCLYIGTDWILGINRYSDLLQADPLIIRVKGLTTDDGSIYFEESVNREECINPTVKDIKIKKENRVKL